MKDSIAVRIAAALLILTLGLVAGMVIPADPCYVHGERE